MPTIELNNEHPQGAYGARVLRAKARLFLAKLDLEEAALSVLLTTDERIQALNREFRQKDEATDVLSFPAHDEGPAIPGMPRSLGDLAISLDTAKRRATEDERPLAAELARYLAHGLLHLLGYDHERSAEDAREMAQKEAALLGNPGMIDE